MTLKEALQMARKNPGREYRVGLWVVHACRVYRRAGKFAWTMHYWAQRDGEQQIGGWTRISEAIRVISRREEG